MLNRELKLVEDGVHCWRLVVQKLLAPTKELLLALDRCFMNALPAREIHAPILPPKGKCGVNGCRGIAS
jgi:hypothetical protein